MPGSEVGQISFRTWFVPAEQVCGWTLFSGKERKGRGFCVCRQLQGYVSVFASHACVLFYTQLVYYLHICFGTLIIREHIQALFCGNSCVLQVT